MANNGKELQKRVESEQQAIVRTTNNDLVCRDCVQRLDDSLLFGNTTKCEFYPQCKPVEVLRRGECEQYVRE